MAVPLNQLDPNAYLRNITLTRPRSHNLTSPHLTSYHHASPNGDTGKPIPTPKNTKNITNPTHRKTSKPSKQHTSPGHTTHSRRQHLPTNTTRTRPKMTWATTQTG